MTGAVSYHAGLAAEDQVARLYEDRGCVIVAHRWRGRHGGEIDLIAQDGDLLIFVEVKKSRSHDRAAQRLSPRQMQRIRVSVEEYLARTRPATGIARQVRFDLALVDAQGQIRILENAYFAM